MADDTMTDRLIRGLRQRTRHARPDFADYGTAFGLELSLEPEHAPSTAEVSTRRGPGWWARLGRRWRPGQP